MLYPRLAWLVLLLCWLGDVGAQSSVGLSVAGEFAERTIRTRLEGEDTREDALASRTEFAFRPSIGVAYERQLNRLFALSLQLRYQTMGYRYDAGTPALDPQTGDPSLAAAGTHNLRYDFVTLPIGVTETWGSGAWRYYIEEYLVPKLYVATVTKRTFDGADDTSERESLDRVNDFHIAVRGGIGFERVLSDILRLRVGIVGSYNFTLTNDEAAAELREHLYGFGPQVSVARVFGRAGSPTGRADEIYY